MTHHLRADEVVVNGRFVVSFVADDQQQHWIAAALEQNVYNDLAGYGRIVPVNKFGNESALCKRSDIECLLAAYREQSVDALMLGKVTRSRIEFEVYDVQKSALVKTGAISISRGATLLQLRMGAFNAFKPFLAKGGILERRQFNTGNVDSHTFQVGASESGSESDSAESDNQKRRHLLIILAVLTCLPYFFSFFGKARKNPERMKICLQWFFPFMLLGLSILAALFVMADLGISSLDDIVLKYLGEYSWSLVALGGFFWGYFLIINIRLIHPHFQGLERVDQQTVLPLLESYLLTFVIKLVFLLAIYSATFYGVRYVADIFAVQYSFVSLILMPLAGVFTLYWVGLWLELMAMGLDGRLSRRHDEYVNIWDAKIRKYFVSYAKRNGATLNEKLLEKIIFLVGDNHGVVSYGGLFGRPRIVVDYDLIRYALGDNNPAVQEYNRPRTRLSKISLFLPHLFPALNGKKRKVGKKKTIKALAHLESSLHYDLNHHASTLKIGQDKIMKGIIMPRLEGKEDLPSLMSDNLEDMSILEDLMQEDTVKSDPFDEDAEIDDSSSHDKDFLFGMLLHKFGELFRYDHLFATCYMAFFRKRLAKDIPYHFPLAEYFSRVADTFVVMNQGLNHLLQYLYFRATYQTSQLTTKGNPDQLLESQNKILADVTRILAQNDSVDLSGEKENREEQVQKASKTASGFLKFDRLDRIIWLSNFCKDPIERHQSFRVRKPLVWLLSLSLVILFSTLFLRSYHYHPIYLEKIAAEKQEILDMIKAAEEQERKKT